MICASDTDSSWTRYAGSRRLSRPFRPGAWLLGLIAAGCAATAPEEGRTVLSTRTGETYIQVTESEQGGAKIVRVKTQFRGEESTIVLNIDEPVYEIEIPLSIEQVVPGVSAGAPGGGPGGVRGNFSDLLAAQYLEKAQEMMLNGDYNGALRQVDLVLTVNPDHVQALTMKGSVYYAMGNYTLANQTWEQVLVLDPSNEEVRNFQDFIKASKGPQQPNAPSAGVGPAPQAPAPAPGSTAQPGGAAPAQTPGNGRTQAPAGAPANAAPQQTR